jgi:hypothetical protein
MEHVTEAIKQAEQDLVDTREELRMARELVASLEQDAKRIEIELVGLRSYAQRRGLADPEPTTSAATGITSISDRTSGGQVVPIGAHVSVAVDERPDLVLMSRNEAVSTVMRMAPGPMDRTAIHEQCALAGRHDSLDDISLSLSGLKRAGRVEKLGRGLWRLAEDDLAGAAR